MHEAQKTTPAASGADAPPGKRAPTLYAIIAFKLLKGSLFVVLAIALYCLSDNNLPEEYRNFLNRPFVQKIFHALRVHPGTNGMFTLYDDDGASLGYRDGSDSKTVWIRFRWDDSARRITLETDERMKKWAGSTRVFAVEVAGSIAKPRLVEFRGTPVAADL